MSRVCELEIPATDQDDCNFCNQCKHGLSIGSFIYGTDSSSYPLNHEAENDDNGKQNVKWATELDSPITSLASSDTSPLMAASTINGSVYIVDTENGDILMQKSISNGTQSSSYRISFVQGKQHVMSNEMLLIYNLHEQNERTTSQPDGILVSNLNKEAIESSKIKIDGIKFTDCPAFISTICVCKLEQEVLRFVTGFEDGSVSVYDYQIDKKKMALNCHSFVNSLPQHADLMNIGTSSAGENVLVIPVYESDEKVSICWYDLNALNCIGRHNITSNNISIKALASIKHCFENSIAAAMIISNESEDKLVIVQGAVCEMMDNVQIRNIQQVFSMKTSKNLEIGGLVDSGSNNEQGLKVRFSVFQRHDRSNIRFKEFQSGPDNLIAKIRLHLSQKNFDEADQLIASVTESELSSSYGSIHSSEAVLARFCNMLEDPMILSGKNKDVIKECLRRLSFGAVSGGSSGVKCLLDASKSLYDWNKGSDVEAEHNSGPNIRDYRRALSAMAMSIANSLKSVAPKYSPILKRDIGKLQDKALALKTVETMLEGSADKSLLQLNAPLLHIKNHNHLYQILIENGLFHVAESMRKTVAGSEAIDDDAISSSVLYISKTIHPERYCNWLEKVVFARLSIKDKKLDSIFDWVCTNANAFDHENSFGIESSILLLQTVEKAYNKMTIDNYRSMSNVSSFESPSVPSQIKMNSESHNPPRGTILTSKYNDLMNSNQSFEIMKEEACFKVKLFQARVLQCARTLGLPESSLRLANFEEGGGCKLAAKELTKQYFEQSWSDLLSDHSDYKAKILQFCSFVDIKFDHVVELCCIDLCSNENIASDSSVLSRARDVVEACYSADTKCKITLRFLRTAQMSVYKPETLKSLARDALKWATSSEILSELEEASRLLGIDEILRKYCGHKATEIFSVSDPKHSFRLVEFVGRKIENSSALDDILYLCNAFTHLSPLEHCASFIERYLMSSDISISPDIGQMLLKIHNYDEKLSERVGVRLCMFCVDLMNSEDESDASFERICSAAIDICRNLALTCPTGNILRGHKMLCPENTFSPWTFLASEFQRIQDLKNYFAISTSLWDLRQGQHTDELSEHLVKIAVKDQFSIDENTAKKLKVALGTSKRGISLLHSHDTGKEVITSCWCKAVGKVACNLILSGNEDIAIILIETSGILDEIHNPTVYESITKIVIWLCSKATAYSSKYNEDQNKAMKNVIHACSLLHDHALVHCHQSLIPSMMFLSNLVDVVTQIILRSDSGVGEEMTVFRKQLFEKARKYRAPKLASVHALDRFSVENDVIFHQDWYRGDGLLLPPSEAIVESMMYCKELLSFESTKSLRHLDSILSFLGQRGVHGLSLRLLSNAKSIVMSTQEVDGNFIQDQSNLLSITLLNLAERCLGSSGAGNISGGIDYELAVPILQTLNIKTAFKVFKRCLPSALTRRDFGRVTALSLVGMHAAGVNNIKSLTQETLSFTWNNQSSFVLQCQQLSKKAFWWKLLQELGVKFDPSSFDTNDEEKHKSLAYIKSLLPSIVERASSIIEDAMMVQHLLSQFCEAFELDQNSALDTHLAFLLSPLSSAGSSKSDPRSDLSKCSAAVNKILIQFSDFVQRTTAIRKCVILFEAEEHSGQDFDRYSMILCLYNSELRKALTKSSSLPNIQIMWIREEMDRIDRRQDALTIISSYYSDSKFEDRPKCQLCFQPLPEKLMVAGDNSNKNFANILGYHDSASEDYFDPLKPLLPFLRSDTSQSTVSALAPICIAIGVPSGSVHVRALMQKFEAAKELGGECPSFTTEVLPVIKRLRMPNDGAELTEWCTSKYEADSHDRLLCLEVGLDIAIKASTQAEQMALSASQKTKEEFERREKSALRRVERMSLAKSALSDILTAKTVVEKSLHRCNDSMVISTAAKMIEKARLRVPDEEFAPEKFVESLLLESSLLAAELSLDPSTSFSINALRRTARAIHDACCALEEQYSHISIGRVSRSLVRRWLIHGDEGASEANEDKTDINEKSIVSTADESMDFGGEEDDTMDFVLDLKIASQQAVWNNSTDGPQLKRLKTMTADEEQSSLRAKTTRELSEINSIRSALRIAFVMSFTKNFHSSHDQSIDEENLDPNDSLSNNSFSTFKKVEEKKHAEYLLKLVFSSQTYTRSQESSFLDNDKDTKSVLSYGTGNNQRLGRREGKARTFAMRHRALRAVSILCSDDVINETVKEEGYLSDQKCTLSMCAFGSFIAKEIEEMGLALPHSDLVQLSMMDKTSYARTLWRQYGRGANHGFKGRLMVLMIELAVNDGAILDDGLVSSILQDVNSLNLPRTNLLVCECMSTIMPKASSEVKSQLLKIMKKLVASILHDLRLQDSKEIEVDSKVTVCRLQYLLGTFLSDGVSEQEIGFLVNALSSAALCSNHDQMKKCIYEVIASVVNAFETEEQESILSKIQSDIKGDSAFSRIMGKILGVPPPNQQEYQHMSVANDCLSCFTFKENDYTKRIFNVLDKNEI